MRTVEAEVVAHGQAVRRPGRRSRRHQLSRLSGYLYILPALALFGSFVVYPLIQGVWISLYDWDGFTLATWVGLDNYRSILTDPEIRGAFVHSLVMLFFYSVLPIAVGLVITAAFSGRRVRGAPLYRAVLFLPQVLPAVAIGIVWRWMYAPEGPINNFLRAIGAGALARGWLGDFTLALPAVGAVGTWVTFGFVMVLLLAGVQKIPADLYDAAKVDGAGRMREFTAVTLPGLRNELVVASMVTVIAGFRVFDLIFVTTSGGPGTATSVPALQVYRESFQYGKIGSGAAVGMILAFVIFVVVLTLTRITERDRT